jgi:hypothetical protein
MSENKQRSPEAPSLLGVRLKLDRTVEHLDMLEAEMRAYSEREPYGVGDLVREDDCFVLRLKVHEEPDQRWGVIAGEILHNLRSALDNLIWQLVLLNGRTPGRHNQFPICIEPPKPGALGGVLRGVYADHRVLIEDLQPYRGSGLYRRPRSALAPWTSYLGSTGTVTSTPLSACSIPTRRRRRSSSAAIRSRWLRAQPGCSTTARSPSPSGLSPPRM